MANLPMFPLGSVLFPGMLLPLHVFEPRYRALVKYCLANEPEFGVALITRGQETGGGEERSQIATVSRILEVGEFPDGRYALQTVGVRRVKVLSWGIDDPYPQAQVEDWDDDMAGDASDGLADRVIGKLRRLLAMSSEAGFDVPPATTDLSDDPLLASYHAAALAPISTHDQQRLLIAGGPTERWKLLDEMLDEQFDILRFHVGGDER
jgi:uncharacterized protein